MNYKKKIRETQVQMDILLKYINQMQEPPRKLVDEVDVLAKQHYQLLNKYYEKSQDIRSAIVTFFQVAFVIAIGIIILKFIVNN